MKLWNWWLLWLWFTFISYLIHPSLFVKKTPGPAVVSDILRPGKEVKNIEFMQYHLSLLIQLLSSQNDFDTLSLFDLHGPLLDLYAFKISRVGLCLLFYMIDCQICIYICLQLNLHLELKIITLSLLDIYWIFSRMVLWILRKTLLISSYLSFYLDSSCNFCSPNFLFLRWSVRATVAMEVQRTWWSRTDTVYSASP